MVREQLDLKIIQIENKISLLVDELQKEADITPPYSWTKEYQQRIVNLKKAKELVSKRPI